MPLDSNLSRSFTANVDWAYAGLVRTANADLGPDPEFGLGGRLLYADELSGAGSVLVVAANIAGAASLTATADVATQKQAIRDGVIDFLVNNLGEALRVLKNEIRKRETVAVCVAQPPEEVERDMAEFGVLPDLLPPGALNALRFETFLDQGAQQIDPVSAGRNQTVLTWSVDRAPALWFPKLDAIALDCLGSSQSTQAWSARRWLHYAPRYLGRLAQGVHLLRCQKEVAHGFLDKVRELAASGQLDVAVDICLSNRGSSESHRLSPPSHRRRSEGSVLFPAGSFNPGP
jgi:hypothetical protein